MSIKFKIGDRVEVVKESVLDRINLGDIGTVKHIRTSSGDIGVEWKNMVIGHRLDNNSAKEGHGWYVYPAHIKITEKKMEGKKKSKWLLVLLIGVVLLLWRFFVSVV